MSSPLIAPDPDFTDKVKASFARQEVMKTIGADLLKIEPGKVQIGFQYDKALTQQHGFIHAGIIATILDSACGYAAFSMMPKKAAVLSIEFKVNLLSPAKGERFIAMAHVVKSGRTISVTEAELIAINKDSKKRIATMTGTMMAVYDRPGIED